MRQCPLSRRSPILPVLACLAAGVVIHELGHALAAFCCGAAVTDLVLVSTQPRVYILGSLTPAQEIFVAVAGSGAVLAVWLLWHLLRPGWRLAGETLSCIAAIELLGWSLSALNYPAPDISRDVSRFLRAAQLHPAWVIAGCLLLAAAGLLIARWTRRPRT